MKVIIMEVLIVVVYAENVKALTVSLFLKKQIEACLLCLMTYSNANTFVNRKPD